jgi:hypothetical protein
MEDKITAKIKFEIGDFADKCLALYKENIDASVRKTYEQFYDQVQSSIKNQIIQTVCGKDMLDPQYVREIPVNRNYKGDNSWLVSLERLSLPNDNAKKFNDFRDKMKLGSLDEKVFLWCRSQYTGIIITNKAKIVVFSYNVHYNCRFDDYNFTIPYDYLQILTLLYGGNSVDSNGNAASYGIPEDEYNKLLKLIQVMRDMLYDRRFVPLYTEEIVEENKQLKAKYEEYQKDYINLENEKHNFDIQKKYFDEYVQPYTNIEKEKEEILCEKQKLQEERDKLRLIAKKIQIEREKLEKEKEIIEKIDIIDF